MDRKDPHMKHFTALVAALAILLSIATASQANTITPDQVVWTYNFSPGSPAVTADGNPAAGVTFTNEPTKTAVGSSDIVATNLRVFSTATAAAPEMLSANGAYSLTLKLASTDQFGMPVTADMVFTGKLTGPFSAENANVANMFGPFATQTKALGGFNFTVSLIAYTPPGPPDQTNAGSISAHVTISAITPAALPEPTTLMLTGLGMSFLGGAAWRKRKQAKVANTL